MPLRVPSAVRAFATAADAGIKVSNTPGAVVAATADVGIFLLIGALRNFNHGMMKLRRGEWKNGVARGHDPEGKIMGVLGMGDIGTVTTPRH
jgi:D-3-phosphoglycerate dehydrogenase